MRRRQLSPRRATGLAAAAAVIAVAAALPRLWQALHAPAGHRLVDLSVYRDAGLSLLHHRDVYNHLTPAAPHPLPFTYPALAALVAVPLALIGVSAVQVLWTLLSVLLLAVSVRFAFADVLPRLPAPRVLCWVAVTALCVQLEPVYDVFRFGQVGLLLLALVSADLLATRPGRPRGTATGVAAALKLTPAVFVPYLWLAGRRRAALTAAGTAVGLTLLAFAVAPHTSADFWFSALGNSDRLGDNAGTSDQAIRGMALRAGLPGAATVLLVAAVAVAGLWRASRADTALGGLAVTGLLAVLLSPVAWIHHLVWVVPVLGVLAAARRWGWLVVVAGCFALPLPWWGRTLVRHHVTGGRLVEDAYGLAALALVLLLPLGPRAVLRLRRRGATVSPPRAAGPLPPSPPPAPASPADPTARRRAPRPGTPASR